MWHCYAGLETGRENRTTCTLQTSEGLENGYLTDIPFFFFFLFVLVVA